MQSKTWIALGAMAVIGLLAFVTLRQPEKGEQIGPRERPIAALKAGDIKELALSANNGKDVMSAKLQDGKWQLSTPVSYPADQALAKTAIEQLEKISFGDLVTEKKEKYAGLEVADDNGAHVTAKDGGGKVIFDAWIGKAVSGFTMVRPVGKDQVWQATGLFKYSYARPAKDWRDHSVMSFNKDAVKSLAVAAGGQSIELEKLPSPPADPAEKNKPAPEGKWKVTQATVKVDPLDDSVANQMVQALSSLQAADFADGARVEDSGLDKPRYRISVTTSGTPMVLLLGNARVDQWYAQVEGKPQVYLMHKYGIDRVAQKPVDFRDKTMVKTSDADLTEVDVTKGTDKFSLVHGAEGWSWGKGGKGELDAAKVKGLVSAFDDFKGSSFADPADLAVSGLAKPTGEVVLHLRDKSAMTVRFGANSKDGTDTFVQKVGSPDVMMVKKFTAERVLKTAGDLEKTAAKPGPPGGMPGMGGMGKMQMPPGMQMPHRQ